LAWNVIDPSVFVELRVFPVRLRLPTRTIPENTVGFTPLGVNVIVLLLLLIVLPVTVNVARSGTIIFEKKILELIGPNLNLGMKRNLFPGDR
jgi:hypothetical protein